MERSCESEGCQQLRDNKSGARGVKIRVLAEAECDAPVCWICLDGPDEGQPLTQPCSCPRYVHATCLARWQLQSAGSRREVFCDFCSNELPDWKAVLCGTSPASAPAVMNVNFNGRTYSFEVLPGEDGYRLFTAAIRKAFSLPSDSELNITFTCDEPSSGSLLTLQGAGAYDAAVHCASVSAGRRDTTNGPGHNVIRTAMLAGPQQGLDTAAGVASGRGHMRTGAAFSNTSSRALRGRRGPNIGRKLRAAFTDLLAIRT